MELSRAGEVQAQFLSHGRASLGLLLLAIGLSGCAPDPPRPNVLILLVDALPAEHLGAYGYDRDTSPRLDGLSAESTLFVNAYAQSPWTKPSIPTLFTSLYPIQHRVYEGHTPRSANYLQSDTLSEELLTIAEVLRDAGFRTGAFVNNAHLPADHGFAQGFEVYEQANFSAGEINDLFLGFLETQDAKPFFAYLHYLDVHWPFQPAKEYRDRFGVGGGTIFDRDDWSGLRDRINDGRIKPSAEDRQRLVDLHDAGILELDQRIGELLDVLRERGLMSNTLILFTSDHGEELMEHGRVGHGGRLFEEVLRIPFMIRLPGDAPTRPERRDDPARLLDVFPTLLGALGIPAPEHLEGRDLLAGSNFSPELIAETRNKKIYQVSLRRGNWKYIRRYRSSRVRQLDALRPETFGLQVGMRIKAKGWFEADGTLVARKLSVKDAGDDDLELSGPISDLDEGSGRFKLYGFQMVPDDDLDGPDGGAPPVGLENGTWVKVEGDPSPDDAILIDKLERIPEGERKTEIEGIIASVEAETGQTALVRIGPARVRVTERTRIKGTAAAAPTVRIAAEEDVFELSRLRSEEGLETDQRLFNLGSDPAELRNLAAEERERVGQLQAELDRWLERMAGRPSVAPGERKVLDEREIERLRQLGYIE